MPPPELSAGNTRIDRGILAVLLIIATGLRAYEVGVPSLWYDEVVTMRLAKEPGPAALLRLLGEIDATRAPLHPLWLHGWIAVFGPSDLSARLSSAVAGTALVAVVWEIARKSFGVSAAHWAAWLSAISPALVRYSREVRMYSLLVLISAIGWLIYLELGRSPTRGKFAAYLATLVALAYCHPLGLFMIAAQVPAFAITRPFSIKAWATVQVLAAILIAPWIPRYTDHPPEYLLNRYSIKFLLGAPIEFIGGNFLVLAGFCGLIGWGVFADSRKSVSSRRLNDAVALGCWFGVPLLLLYGYSAVSHPIFGPARYNLFTAPAYLILVGLGLSKLPKVAQLLGLPATLLLAAPLLGSTVFDPELKADWRAAAAWLDHHLPRATLVVSTRDPSHKNVEIEAARYYCGPDRDLVAASEAVSLLGDRASPPEDLAYSVGARRGQALEPDLGKEFPAYRREQPIEFPGLRLIPLRRQK